MTGTRTTKDVEAYTVKVIAYETDYPSDDTFHAQMLYICPEPHAEPKLLRSCDDHIGPGWKSGKVLRWFEGENPWESPSRQGAVPLAPSRAPGMIPRCAPRTCG